MNKNIRKVVLVVVTILIVVLIFFSYGGRERVSFFENLVSKVIVPVQKTFSGIGFYLEERIEPFVNVLSYKTINENLMLENKELKDQIVSLTMNKKELQELRELKKALRFVGEEKSNSFVSANVIGKDVGNWFNFFIIDVGLNDGVVKNSTVVNSRGLVGQVYEAGDNYSKVISIIDNRSSVGFEMLRTKKDYYGVLSGNKNYELVGDFYDPVADVKKGEYIVTSGLGIYPKGILIGKIFEVENDKDSILKRVKVEPVVDFKSISKVLVIPYTKDGQD